MKYLIVLKENTTDITVGGAGTAFSSAETDVSLCVWLSVIAKSLIFLWCLDLSFCVFFFSKSDVYLRFHPCYLLAFIALVLLVIWRVLHVHNKVWPYDTCVPYSVFMLFSFILFLSFVIYYLVIYYFLALHAGLVN